MTLATYLDDVLSQYSDRRITRNITTLVEHIIEDTSLQLWSLSSDKAEFERQKRLLDGSLKSVLDEATLSTALREIGTRQTAGQEEVVLLHDPCDIRKPYASELECLGTVRSLQGQIIPGYRSFDTVLVDLQGRHVLPFDITLYSTGDPHYVTEDELSHVRRGTLAHAVEPERAARIQQYLQEDSYVNLNRVMRHQLERVSAQVKAEMPGKVVWHILDRQFDGDDYFRLIDHDLNDLFVIRLKVSRNSNEWTVDADTDTVSARKLTEAPFAHGYRDSLAKVRLKHTTYQQVTRVLEWDSVCISGTDYTVVRVTLLDRKGRPIYPEPMLLLTNVALFGADDAREIYRLYLLRAKIEGVFKFCKQVLGWETVQVRDYLSIKNLLALGFFVAGYFYLIDSALIADPVVMCICELGGGKGRLTRYYFLLGMQKLLVYRSVERQKEIWLRTGHTWAEVFGCIL